MLAFTLYCMACWLRNVWWQVPIMGTPPEFFHSAEILSSVSSFLPPNPISDNHWATRVFPFFESQPVILLSSLPFPLHLLFSSFPFPRGSLALKSRPNLSSLCIYIWPHICGIHLSFCILGLSHTWLFFLTTDLFTELIMLLKSFSHWSDTITVIISQYNVLLVFVMCVNGTQYGANTKQHRTG